MVKSTYWQLGKVTIGGGISQRFGVGICIDRWSFNIDFGPFWIFIEW
jgi:hypothetical protein